MGVISILLGIIAIFVFVGLGAVLGNVYLQSFSMLAQSFTALKTDLSDTTIMIVFICAFGFIGLLIGMNLIMHGLNYNKLCKIQKRVRRL